MKRYLRNQYIQDGVFWLVISLLVLITIFNTGCIGPRTMSPGFLPEQVLDDRSGTEAASGPLKRVLGSREFLIWNDWSATGWHRIGTDDSSMLPVFVLVAEGNMACIVPGDIWATQPREIACPSGWRHWRGPMRRTRGSE